MDQPTDRQQLPRRGKDACSPKTCGNRRPLHRWRGAVAVWKRDAGRATPTLIITACSEDEKEGNRNGLDGSSDPEHSVPPSKETRTVG